MRIFEESLLEEFIKASKKLVILAIGNPIRCDDAVGLRVGTELTRLGLHTIIAESAPENYYFKIVDSGYKDVIIIDAVRAPYPAGTILILDKKDLALYPATTHDIPLSLLLDLFDSMGIRYLIIGIVPKNLNFGEKISPELEKSVRILTEAFKKIIARK